MKDWENITRIVLKDLLKGPILEAYIELLRKSFGDDIHSKTLMRDILESKHKFIEQMREWGRNELPSGNEIVTQRFNTFLTEIEKDI